MISVNKIKSKLRNNYWFWRFFHNRKAALRYLSSGSLKQKKVNIISAKLQRDGIAIANANDLIPSQLIDELVSKAEALRCNNKKKETDKSYANFYLDRRYDSKSIWARIAESPNVVAIAKNYFKMDLPRLVYYDLWENSPSGEAPKNAQLWHRDRDDLQILKVFIYLTDVDERTGAFFYAPGTHILGKHQQEPQYSLDETGTKRTSDDQMGQVVPKTDWISGAGKKLSIVFADTHGFHKGGYVKEDYRFIYTCMYLSPYSGRIRFSNVKK